MKEKFTSECTVKSFRIDICDTLLQELDIVSNCPCLYVLKLNQE